MLKQSRLFSLLNVKINSPPPVPIKRGGVHSHSGKAATAIMTNIYQFNLDRLISVYVHVSPSSLIGRVSLKIKKTLRLLNVWRENMYTIRDFPEITLANFRCKQTALKKCKKQFVCPIS